MRRVLDRLADRQHLLVLLISLWLILTSPWIMLRRGIPSSAGFLDYAHIALGLAMVPLALAYALTNTLGGRWRDYFPWLAGNLAEVKRDLTGLLKARLPQPGGAGLFSLIEGIVLILLLATAVSGLGWFLLEGSRPAMVWREWHIVAADALVVALIVHAIAASLHLVEFLLD
ncbi:MAG: cytochrome b/b6 domain-containing protein [Gammaproteobacteria bacterium]